MFKNYLKIALRNLKNQKIYSIINISGLSLGMSCCILIFLFIQNELSYDRYHANSDRIYRITQETKRHDKILYSAITPNPLAPELLAEFPEIIHAVRINSIYEKVLIGSENKFFKEDRFFLADPFIFNVFTFPLIKGIPQKVLTDPFSVVISEEIAKKYFGNKDPIGKILNYENKFDFTVTGVMKNIPLNSHFRCDFIAPFTCANKVYWEGFAEDRIQSSVHTYVVLNKNASTEELEAKFPIKEYMIVIPLENENLTQKYTIIKNEFLNYPEIISVTGASNVLSRIYSDKPVWWEGSQADESMRIQKIYVDYNFINTFGIELLAGRNFSREFLTDEREAFIINGSTANTFGWEHPIGKHIDWAYEKEKRGAVIGIIDNFHFRSLHQKIEPLILRVRNDNFLYIYVKLNSESISKTLTFLKNKWAAFFPERPFDYFFLDDDINKMYKSEEKMSQIFRYISLLTIFIACLGLLGLISYTTEQRAREIGIRKVLGASVRGIVLLITKEFFKWVIIANIIAIPIGYYVMNKWLQGFAYRINMNLWTFFIASLIAFIIALFTVSFQAIKAALANPVDSIRYE